MQVNKRKTLQNRRRIQIYEHAFLNPQISANGNTKTVKLSITDLNPNNNNNNKSVQIIMVSWHQNDHSTADRQYLVLLYTAG